MIQTISPQQWIKDYQQEIVPPHLRGIMRAGYWDNRLYDGDEYFVDRVEYTANGLTYKTLGFTGYNATESQEYNEYSEYNDFSDYSSDTPSYSTYSQHYSYNAPYQAGEG